MDGSHHAKGGQILASLDNLLGEVVGGPAAVNAGCQQCHGAEIVIGQDGRPIPTTWPNTGIGRVNPDGSLGSCTACHSRHRFSKAQARTPDTCGKCHVGPDHPQIEVYNESKHGIIYRAKVDEMNLESDKWVAGVDYSAAPTCATCHMSASPLEPATHNVADRISWTLRPPISEKINLVRLENGDEFDIVGERPELPNVGDEAKGSKVVEVLTWQDRRQKMENVCAACHTSSVIQGHYFQFDNVVDLYNEKFAKPIAAIMADLKKEGYITAGPFDESIEWIWWEIWHHEGRRARHGASMSGPDYTWWHGMYDVAKHTYFEFIPELKEVVHKKDGNEKRAEALLTQYFKPIEGHAWYFEGMSKEAIEKVRKGFEARYGTGALK
jgi:cytochrome c553